MKKLELTLNGQPRPFSEGESLASLIVGTNLDQGVAVVEHNGTIIAAEQQASILLQPADVVEIIQFVGGG